MRTPKYKRSSSLDSGHRSTKRRKFQYSKRDPPWKEILTLPKRFHENGRGTWPAERISNERESVRGTEYLVHWEKHPKTGEVWAPTWEPEQHILPALKRDWQSIRGSHSTGEKPQPKHTIHNARSRVSTRRIIPDSSEEIAEHLGADGDQSSLLSLVASSDSFGTSPSLIEIPETQQPIKALLTVSVPSAPVDKNDYHSIRGSQLSTLDELNTITSTQLAQDLQIDSSGTSLGNRGSTRSGRGFSIPGSVPSHQARTTTFRYPQRILDYHHYETDTSSSAGSSQGCGSSLHSISSTQIDRTFPSSNRLVSDSRNSLQSISSTTASNQRLPRQQGRSSSEDPSSWWRSPSTMTSRATRQSPRLQVATPVVSSPRASVRTNSNRSRPEISSPLATTMPEIPGNSAMVEGNLQPFQNGESYSPETMQNHLAIPTTIPPGDMHISSATSLDSLSMYDNTAVSLPIQQSIEEEPQSSIDEQSIESKASSSQESLRNERVVPQVDGLIMPTRPILGDDEYCIALPAEGKVQAMYAQTIRVKRKSILRFISRRGAVMDSSTSATKTHERNEMIELIQRLHDTTTHTDLGLPGIPTQYIMPSQEHAAYAEYAGSKFVFLGHLVSAMTRRNCTLVVMAQSATMPLLEEYLAMRKVKVHRRDQKAPVESSMSDQPSALNVELLITGSSNVVPLPQRPLLIIAFDASFYSQDAQLLSLREHFPGQLPVLHLITTNASEHVERCLPLSMPSPMRLKILVRATYQARERLGGEHTYVPAPSDEPLEPGRSMDLAELHRALRKSPKRKLENLAAIIASTALSEDFNANWTLHEIPDLVYDDLEDSLAEFKTSRSTSETPYRVQARSRTPVARTAYQRGRSQTPGSRVDTPNAKKRYLEPDAPGMVAKRQRMTPVPEGAVTNDETGKDLQHEDLERQLDALRRELTEERRMREAAELARDIARAQQTEWREALATLQRRYEKRMKKSHQQTREVKALSATVENANSRVQSLNSSNSSLREQASALKAELSGARHDLTAAGGDIAVLEAVREEARKSTASAASLEKSLANHKRDFEFTRNLYQEASGKATQLAAENDRLEKEKAQLAKDAGDEKRRLKELNYSEHVKQQASKIVQLEQEKRSREQLIKKQEAEIGALKRNRGVQTRGSSVQPGSPAPRSRQSSPAPGHLAPPTGSRASVLRHER